MKNWPFWVGCLIVAVIAGFFIWPTEEVQETQLPVAEPPVAEAPPPPVTRYPIEAVPEPQAEPEPDLQLDQPLPVLEQSDARMAELLEVLFREQRLDRFFLVEYFIERFVVMVDNLPRAQLPTTHRPIKKIQGEFLASGPPDRLVLDPANDRRYVPLIALLEKVDRQQVLKVYLRLYPLFQEAYDKLGYQGRQFNDRLVEVIDHLLATPIVNHPIPLVRPKYYYQFADPDLEALSAGQKALIRTGPENAARIKALLMNYRQSLAGESTR